MYIVFLFSAYIEVTEIITWTDAAVISDTWISVALSLPDVTTDPLIQDYYSYRLSLYHGENLHVALEVKDLKAGLEKTSTFNGLQPETIYSIELTVIRYLPGGTEEESKEKSQHLFITD